MKDGDKILVYKDVISEIKKERIVLFTGLGCDIAYLEKLVRKEAVDARKLFTIELMCDGVTDEIVQREFVLNIEKKYRTKVIDFNIRYKEEDGFRRIFMQDLKMEKNISSCLVVQSMDLRL